MKAPASPALIGIFGFALSLFLPGRAFADEATGHSDRAKAHFALGWTEYMEAKSVDDAATAAWEFYDAVSLVPLWGEAKYNQNIAWGVGTGQSLADRPPLLDQPNVAYVGLFPVIPDPIPAEARDHFVTGETILKWARGTVAHIIVAGPGVLGNAETLTQAAEEFHQAALLAPDWLEARYNYELVKEAIPGWSSVGPLTLFEQTNPYTDNTNTRYLPPISQEARSHYIMGYTMLSKAKRPENFIQAVAELKKALSLAPEWPDAEYNLVLAEEAAGDYSSAVSTLDLYMQTPLLKSERQAARDKMDQLAAEEKMMK